MMQSARVSHNISPLFHKLEAVQQRLLLEKQQASAMSPAFYSHISRFSQGAVAALRQLDVQERKVVQSYLDFWRDELPPYAGLQALTAVPHAPLLQGETAVSNLINRLWQERIIAIVGPPNSGKSSLVLAGLLPALKAGDVQGSQDWHYLAPMTPGSNPLTSLDTLLGHQPATTLAEFGRQTAKFQRNPYYLLQTIDQITDKPTVLVVDQFEEQLALGSHPSVQEAFVANLAAFVNTPTPKHTLILTMRSGYEAYLEQMADFWPLFAAARWQMTLPSEQRLRTAVVQPAKTLGVSVSAPVAERLLEDVLVYSTPLPLLQFGVQKLWAQRAGNHLTEQDYKQLGNVEQAVLAEAEGLYGHLDNNAQQAMQHILLSLVQVTEQGVAVHLPVLRTQLLNNQADPKGVAQVLAAMVQRGLVRERPLSTENDSQVELVYDLLPQAWERLADWIGVNHGRLLERQHLREAAKAWSFAGRDSNQLLSSDTALAAAQAWPDLNRLETAYVAASWRQLAARQQPLVEEQPIAPTPLLANQAAWSAAEPTNRRRLPVGGWSLLLLLASLIVFGFALWWANQTVTDTRAEQATLISESEAELAVVREEATAIVALGEANALAQAERLQAQATQTVAVAVARVEVIVSEQTGVMATLVPQQTAVSVAQAQEAESLAQQQVAEAAQATAEAAVTVAEAQRQTAVAARQSEEERAAQARHAIPIITADLITIDERNKLYHALRQAEEALAAASRTDLSTTEAERLVNQIKEDILGLRFGEVVADSWQPTMDGHLGDWPQGAAANSLYGTNGIDFSGGQVRWQLAWDSDHLYVATEVTNRWPQEYAVNLQLDRVRTSDYFAGSLSADELQLTFLPKGDDSTGVSTYRFRADGEPRRVIDVFAYSQPLEDGYTLEAAIPWENLEANGVPPRPNEVWGLSLNLVMAEGVERAAVNVVKSHVPGRVYDDPATWGTLTFQ